MIESFNNLSFVEQYRIVTGLVFLLAVFVFMLLVVLYMRRNAINTDHLLRNAAVDRRERQEVIVSLQRTTTDQVAKMKQVLDANVEAQRTRDQVLHELQRTTSALHDKVDKNTELTKEAAQASGDALHAANTMNEKIQATQERLLEVAKGTVVNVGIEKKDKA